jgi:vacuolar iron transporter family protein
MSRSEHEQPNEASKPADFRRWRQYLADERAEARVYRDLARRRTGSEREILLALAEAEGRHEAHWLQLLGDQVGKPRRPSLQTSILSFLARRFGSIFVLALAQRAETRSPYRRDIDATDAMAADELIHGEVIRALAMRGRNRLSGTFRAAIFGANDGLVSNLALVLGMSATGVGNNVVLATGAAGLLAGALSMAAGEYVSIRSQREMLEASTATSLDPRLAISHLDVNHNELALVFRARGMAPEDARREATKILSARRQVEAGPAADGTSTDVHEAIGTALGASTSSFIFFASGAIIPVLPYIVGLGGPAAAVTAAILVGLTLIATGGTVGVLSGTPPFKRAIRQLLIGYGAAAVTYALGLAFGISIV